MKISNQFQMLHLAHPNSTGADISVALVGDHLNGKSWILYFIYSLQKKQHFKALSKLKKTKQKNNHCLLLYQVDVSIHPNPSPNHRSDVEKNNHCFPMVGVKSPSSNPLRPFCPTSSCLTVSTNSWVKPVVMPAMRCCGRFRSLNGEQKDTGVRTTRFLPRLRPLFSCFCWSMFVC